MNKQILNLAFLGVLLVLFAFTQVMPAKQINDSKSVKNTLCSNQTKVAKNCLKN